MILAGSDTRKLDEKNRLSLPSKFRKVLPKDLMVTLAPKGECLYVYDADGFETWVTSLFDSKGGFDAGNLSHVNLHAALYARARSVEVDGSGRIGLNAKDCQAADLEREVVLNGNGDHLEIWNAKRWDDFYNSIDLSDLFSE